MAATFPSSDLDRPVQRTDHARWPDWAREPLLHFVLIGVVLFALDHLVVSGKDDPHKIVVTRAIDTQAREAFKNARGRDPDAKELQAVRQVWLDNEVLYREGIAMQMDRGDAAIRDRVIFKSLSAVDSGVKLPAIDDTKLHEWFESHRTRYDEPPRVSFQEAALAGDSSEPAVRTFVSALNAGAPGDSKAGLRVFKDRPTGTLAQSFGDDFPKTLEESAVGEWRAVQTRDGWRAIRVDSMTPGKPARYELLVGVLLQDWKDDMAANMRTAAVRALAKKYKIEYEAAQ